MRAVICESPGSLRLIDRPVPEPGVGTARVAIRRVGVCGTDLHGFRGRQPFLEYPRVFGHELSGVIDALGDPQDEGGLGADLQVGTPVVIMPYLHCGNCVACRGGRTNCCARLEVLGVHRDGGMQEHLVVPVSHLIPAGDLALDHGALVECLSIGAHAVRRAGVQSGESVLVCGAGPIGLGVLLAARTAGARLFAIELNEDRRRFVHGVIPELQSTATPSAEWLRGVVGDEGAAVVVDATGNDKSMARAVEYLAHGGRLVFVGLVRGAFSIDHPSFHKREATLLSSRNATREDFEQVIRSFRAGAVDVERLISQRVPLQDAVDGFARWSAPRSSMFKTVLEVG